MRRPLNNVNKVLRCWKKISCAQLTLQFKINYLTSLEVEQSYHLFAWGNLTTWRCEKSILQILPIWKKKTHRSNSNVCLTMSNRNFWMNCLINAFLRHKANMILEDQFPYHYPWPRASMCLGRALLVFQRFDFLVFQLNGLVKLLRLWHELI